MNRSGLVFVSALLALSATGQLIPQWKVFVSQGGWSISHPPHWQIGSCNACKDPKKSDVFVNFHSPNPDQGWVMVELLADRPSEASQDSCLAEVAKTTNLNPHIQEQALRVNDLPALKVRYRTSSGQQIEAVYVVSGARTVEVEFSGDLGPQGSVEPLETLSNYQTYLKMVQSLKVLTH